MSRPSKMHGRLLKFAGGFNRVLGRMLWSPKLVAKGTAQGMRGSTEYQAAKARGYASGVGDNVAGRSRIMKGNFKKRLNHS